MFSRHPPAALRHMSSRTYRSHLERTAESLRSKVCSDIIHVLVISYMQRIADHVGGDIKQNIYKAKLIAVSSATPDLRIFTLTLLDRFSRWTVCLMTASSSINRLVTYKPEV